jgi:Xaa-Pro aminopeptidase
LGTSFGTVQPLMFNVAERIAAIDQCAMRRYRLDRVRAELRARDLAGALLTDPVNIRYATGTRNMSLWTLRFPGRYALITTNGPVVMFEFSTCHHLSRDFETVDEVRSGTSYSYLLAGSHVEARTAQWARELASVLREHGGTNRRLAVDVCSFQGADLLRGCGLELFEGHEPLEQARKLKSREEISAHELSMQVCDAGVNRMREALQPGLTENQLWSLLHDTNIAYDGEYIDCRLLASGPRTNPWFQESSNRVIEAGDLVTFDTDMIGPMGAMSDISRAYVCPGKAATAKQRELYSLAEDQIEHNLALLKPGLTFGEFSEKSWKVPERYFPRRYLSLAHGVGLNDEWPVVLYNGDQQRSGYAGIFEENMVISLESYLGAEGEREGVKLEQQVLITAAGCRLFSTVPVNNALEIR